MSQKALGRVFDVAPVIAPVDTQTGAMTGRRVSLSRAGGVAFIFVKGAGTGSDDPVITVQEHNAASGGTSQNLPVVAEHYRKAAATVTGAETWTRTAQTAGATLTLTGQATQQGVYVVEVMASSLSDGFTHVSVNIADTGAAGAQLGTCIAVLFDLERQAAPARLAASQ